MFLDSDTYIFQNRARNNECPCGYKEVMEILSQVCQDAGFPVYSLQQGDPWTNTKGGTGSASPAPAPTSTTTPASTAVETPYRGGRGRGRGSKVNRGRGRGAKTRHDRPAWQVLQDKLGKLCDLYNLVSQIFEKIKSNLIGTHSRDCATRPQSNVNGSTSVQSRPAQFTSVMSRIPAESAQNNEDTFVIQLNVIMS